MQFSNDSIQLWILVLQGMGLTCLVVMGPSDPFNWLSGMCLQNDEDASPESHNQL